MDTYPIKPAQRLDKMTQATLTKTIGTDGPETVPQFTAIDTIEEWLAWNAGQALEDPDTDTSYFEAGGDDDDDGDDGDDGDDWWDNNNPIAVRSVLEGLYDRSPSLGCNCGGGCIYCS